MVFVTKYRRNALTDAVLTRTEEIMREVCADFEAEMKQFNGEQDHVHLLVHYPAQGPALQAGQLPQGRQLPQTPPGGTSRPKAGGEYDSHVRRYLWGGHFWSGSYFAGSCGGAPLTVVRQYIENQRRPV
ncbi:IS200/IS605 family transposase [Streptomyces sp. NPDC058534]|uniref:IS200/IS605 family transposase n=1 Tax=Streptomyces sp. NPDC058534 TaxID=3346541 RepID=UPI0036582FC2